MSGEQKIERAAEAVEIGPSIGLMAVERLFGREVVGSPQHVFVIIDGE